MIDNEQKFRAYADERAENILWRAHRLANRHPEDHLEVHAIVNNAIRLALSSQGMLYRFTPQLVDDFIELPWDEAVRRVWSERPVRHIELVP